MKVYTNSFGSNVSFTFAVPYSEICNLHTLVGNVTSEHGISRAALLHAALSEFETFKYPNELLNSCDSFIGPTSQEASIRHLTNYQSKELCTDNRILFVGDVYQQCSTNPYEDSRQLLETHRNKKDHDSNNPTMSYDILATASSIPDHIKTLQKVIIYQSRGAFTGGTTALRTFYERSVALGYPSYLCNDTNYNDSICSNPPGGLLLYNISPLSDFFDLIAFLPYEFFECNIVNCICCLFCLCTVNIVYTLNIVYNSDIICACTF